MDATKSKYNANMYIWRGYYPVGSTHWVTPCCIRVESFPQLMDHGCPGVSGAAVQQVVVLEPGTHTHVEPGTHAGNTYVVWLELFTLRYVLQEIISNFLLFTCVTASSLESRVWILITRLTSMPMTGLKSDTVMQEPWSCLHRARARRQGLPCWRHCSTGGLLGKSLPRWKC